MKWLIDFYNERRGMLARYDIEAPLPAEAVRLGWATLLAEHPSAPRHGRPGLFEQAERVGGQDASGWVLYRIAEHSRQGAADIARTDAA
jgi:hypothetical protein